MKEENELIECNKVDCIYRSTNHGNFVSCDYLLKTNELRGCGIGDECTRYKPGEKHHDWMETFQYVSRTM